jgi:predicted PurR-regulated permease PerM
MTTNQSKTGNGHPSESAARAVTPGQILVWGAFGTLLYIAHAAFVPVALALLLSLILSGPVEALHKRRIPRSVSAATILVLALVVLCAIGTWVSGPAQQWFDKAPQTLSTVKQKVRPIAKFMDRVDEFRKNAASISATNRAAPATPVVQGVQSSAPAEILDATGSAIAATLTFVIVTLFLLTGGPPMMARMGAAFADNLNSSHVLALIERVRSEVGHFYVTTTLINVGLGIATGLAMGAWGMPTPYLWGAMAAILNFIPYAGSATTLLTLTSVAIVSFDTLTHVLGVAASYVVLAAIEGQVVQPLLVGRRMQVNPLLIFLGLWFGGLYWGVAGIILATPTLVALKVIAEDSKSGKPMLEFLGPNDQNPDRDARLRKMVGRSGR